LKIFNREKNKQVVGARALDGRVMITSGGIKIKRQENEIGTGKIAGMQHNKVAVKEVEIGKEFGVMIDAKIELAPGDVIEIIEKVS
jgi:translation initiation factor IF-2